MNPNNIIFLLLIMYFVSGLLSGGSVGLFSLLFKGKDSFIAFLLLAPALFFSIVIHEVAHGWMADKMGDSTARWLGRLSLDPRRHFDPVGTLMLFFTGFGWAKPVPININNFTSFRKGLVLVSAAGITANFFLAFLAILGLQFIGPISSFGEIQLFLIYLARINIMLAAFNLIPIPPLDGSKILMGFAPRGMQYTLARIEPYGLFIIIGLLFLGLLDPLIDLFQWIIVTIIKLLIP
jgi:Zn-dependent protease